MPRRIKRIAVVLDDDSGHEAMYVNGKLSQTDHTIYSCDIAREAAGEKVYIEHHVASMGHEFSWKDWPDDLEELLRPKLVLKRN